MDEVKRLPVHVSIIMDGNGRWAQERGKERIYGHAEGVESVRSCTEAAREAGVRYLSLFAFSEENWSRPDGEVGFLMEMMMKSLREEVHSLAAAIDDCMAMTAGNTALTLVIFLSYSGKWDILQAAKRLAAEFMEHPERRDELEDMDIGGFDRYLVTAGIPDPDLIIRTSGEQRLSNYLLWQSAYSEFLFTDVMWPDFRKENFMEALDVYAGRDRRYGKVK